MIFSKFIDNIFCRFSYIGKLKVWKCRNKCSFIWNVLILINMLTNKFKFFFVPSEVFF